MIVAIESHQGALDMQVTTIGLDIAKNVFQVHGIDAAEKVVVRKRVRCANGLDGKSDEEIRAELGEKFPKRKRVM